MRYRRALIEGATYFFTVNLAERSRRLLVEQIKDLREVVHDVRLAHPFEIVAWVVMPDHLHTVWQLPEYDADYAMRWALIKEPVGWGDVGTPTTSHRLVERQHLARRFSGDRQIGILAGDSRWGSFLTPTYALLRLL